MGCLQYYLFTEPFLYHPLLHFHHNWYIPLVFLQQYNCFSNSNIKMHELQPSEIPNQQADWELFGVLNPHILKLSSFENH